MRLYHGTKVLFEKIDLNKAKIGKDFGKGFYLTTNLEQAKTWAKREVNGNQNGYIMEYEFDEKHFMSEDIKIRRLTAYDAEWVEFVIQCRLELNDSSDDIIYDRMADSKYNVLAKALEKYYNGSLSLKKVLKIASFADTKYDQYCFKTQKAVKLLSRVSVLRV